MTALSNETQCHEPVYTSSDRMDGDHNEHANSQEEAPDQRQGT